MSRITGSCARQSADNSTFSDVSSAGSVTVSRANVSAR